MLDGLDIPRSETPVLVHATNVMRNPSAAQVARSLRLRAEVDGERFDLVVLGGGPAGLAASEPPYTEAAQGMLAVDTAGYLLCGSAAASCNGHLSWPLTDREPHLL